VTQPQAPFLLTDEQVQKFICEGFLILQTNFSPEFHRSLLAQLDEVYEKEGNPGNNLLPRIPEIQKVFDHPVITGALTSVLGENYMMHAHRFGHLSNLPTAGGWHKDSYWGYSKMRNHHPWWAMIMYFPQDTPVAMGPTSVIPGTQIYNNRNFQSDGSDIEALASGNEGTFALIHYDIWHRSTANMLGKTRYMLKFEFMRTQAPTKPTWNHQNPAWVTPAKLLAPIAKNELIWEETWNWLSGTVGSLANIAVDRIVDVDNAIVKNDVQDASAMNSKNKLAQLLLALEDSYEPIALAAAYELARHGHSGTDILLHSLHHESLDTSRSAAYGLSVAGASGIAGLIAALGSQREQTVIHTIFALSENREIAADAVPALLRLLDNSSPPIRQAVTEALGMLTSPGDMIMDSLIRCLQDEDAQVRFTAGLALCRHGASAEAAIPQLELALDDENRYVRAHASEALYAIGSERAKDILIRFLLKSRWCPTTTAANAFYP
jgi:hypothetical protein